MHECIVMERKMEAMKRELRECWSRARGERFIWDFTERIEKTVEGKTVNTNRWRNAQFTSRKNRLNDLKK